MANHLIGIMGKKRSGKDTLARFLVENHGYTRISLADPLREAALGLNPIVGYGSGPIRLAAVIGLYGWEGVKTSPYADEVRRTLQRFGTEAVRDVLGPQVWAREMLRRADKVEGGVVVPDVRFPEEYDAIRANPRATHFGLLVRVIGRGVEGDTHPSETALDDFHADVLVDNGPATRVEDLAVHAATLVRMF